MDAGSLGKCKFMEELYKTNNNFMKKQTIYKLVNASTDDTLNTDLFDMWLDEGYKKVMYKLHEKAPSLYRKSAHREIPKDQNELLLPTDLRVLEIIERQGEFDATPKPVIERTFTDESREVLEGFYFIRRSKYLLLRNIPKDLGVLTIHYLPKIVSLVNYEDEPSFDDAFHTILVDYVKGKYLLGFITQMRS